MHTDVGLGALNRFAIQALSLPLIKRTLSNALGVGCASLNRLTMISRLLFTFSAGLFLLPLSSPCAELENEIAVRRMMAQVEQPQRPDRKGLDSMTLEEVMQRLHVPGVSVAVIHGFKVHWAKGYGTADVETGSVVTADTLFQACSISKALTAMAFLRAVQEGNATLDADINRFLRTVTLPPNAFASQANPVTARSLLSHTSGTGDGFGFPGYNPDEARPSPAQVLIGSPPSNVGPVSFERAPFTGYKYSGGGLEIIQLALQDVERKPFDQIMRSAVLDPLGMTRSTFEQPLPPARDLESSRAHDGAGKSLGPKWHVYPEQAAAGLWTTPTELAYFVIEIQKAVQNDLNEGRVLPSALAREMITPTGMGPFGLCLEIQNKGQGWYFSHSGSNWGFRCEFIGHFRKGYGVVVMTNGDNGLPLIAEIEARVANAYGWDSLDKPLPR